MLSFSSGLPPEDSQWECESDYLDVKGPKLPLHIYPSADCQEILPKRQSILQVQGLHNLELDPNGPCLSDFLTEIGPSSWCREEAALWRLRMTRFVLQRASGRDAIRTFFFFRPVSASTRCC